MTRRVTSGDRMRRILSIVPWIAERDGPTIEEVCQRFGIEQGELLGDLEVVFMVGIPPYTPDTLIDVVAEDGRVWIHLGGYFSRPLRLTPQQGLSLLAAGSAVASSPGVDQHGPLARALGKIATAVGLSDGPGVDVVIGSAGGDDYRTITDALTERRQLEIDYYSASRDDHAVRTVDPLRVYSQEGAWYLLGWCHTANDQRVFRIDRMRSVRLLDSAIAPGGEVPGDSVAVGGFVPGADDRRVTIALPPNARWVAQQYPVESVEEVDGVLRVTLAASGDAFLMRLLMRFGRAAAIVAVNHDTSEAACAPLRAVQRDLVDRILARYA